MADLNLISAVNQQSNRVTSPLTGGTVIEMVFYLMLVVAVIFLCAWLFRRMGGMGVGATGLIKILTAISLGSRDRIVLIQVGEKQMLLGISPGRINTLHVFEGDVMAQAQANADQLSINNNPGSGQLSNAFARKLQGFLSSAQRSENSGGKSE